VWFVVSWFVHVSLDFEISFADAVGFVPVHALLDRLLRSAQLEDSRFVLLTESDDVLVMAPQQLRDVVSRAVAEPNPNELRRRTMQDGKSMKIFVLTDDQASVLTRQVPDCCIPCAAMPQQSNVQGTRKNVRQPFAQLLRQWLIEEEPSHLTRRAC